MIRMTCTSLAFHSALLLSRTYFSVCVLNKGSIILIILMLKSYPKQKKLYREENELRTLTMQLDIITLKCFSQFKENKA